MTKFTYNTGLRQRVQGEGVAVHEPDITLDKVTHIDLDNVINVLKDTGPTDISVFMTIKENGFAYVRTVQEAVEAYAAGNLYVMGGNF